jgi:hypothetical protein
MVKVMKAVRDTPSSDCACVHEVLSKYFEQIESYQLWPGQEKLIWPLTLNYDPDLGANGEGQESCTQLSSSDGVWSVIKLICADQKLSPG